MDKEAKANGNQTGEVDRSNPEKLQRLHSLLFGSEIALGNGDTETALGLALRLLGFLLSECKTAEDEAYLKPLLKQAYQRVDAAQDATLVDSQALAQARCKDGFLFRHQRPLDLPSIKGSKYLRPFVCQEQEDAVDRLVQASTSRPCEDQDEQAGRQAANGLKPRKPLMQSKLVTLYATPKVDNSRSLGAKFNSRVGDASTSGLRYASEEEGAVPSSYTKARFLSTDQHRKSDECSDSEVAVPEEEEEDVIARYRANKKRARDPCLPSLRPDKGRVPLKEGSNEDDEAERPAKHFMTASQKLVLDGSQNRVAGGNGAGSSRLEAEGLANQKPALDGAQNRVAGGNSAGNIRGTGIKTLGLPRRGVRQGFVPPFRSNGNAGGNGGATGMYRPPSNVDNGVEDSTRQCLELLAGPDGELPERLRNLDPKLLEQVSNEIMNRDTHVRWDDIAGLDHAKKCVTEMVIWPLLRPDIFQGCRSPGNGLLLFGPPGTGKTMIGKAIAGEANATFFSISASSLTSKWIGEGEKLVRALFGVASCRQPAVIFIDEIDSLLSQRKADGEHESSRRLKTQFLIEMEGCSSGTEKVLLIGATNRPQELDEAARRRLARRLYIPLPSSEARGWIVRSLLQKDNLMTLSQEELQTICSSTEGYSGSDMKHLVKEASMGPLREALMQGKDISQISNDEMRPIRVEDFTKALEQVRPSVSPDELGQYEDWNKQFGGLT